MARIKARVIGAADATHAAADRASLALIRLMDEGIDLSLSVPHEARKRLLAVPRLGAMILTCLESVKVHVELGNSENEAKG